MAQLINITSEALQATVRRLLPSQKGFGEDLQATNVVTPIIDLTPTAEGTQLPQYLQQSLAFGSSTPFSASGGSSDLTSTAGFYRVSGTATVVGGNKAADIRINDGTSDKVLISFQNPTAVTAGIPQETVFDYIFFIRPGDTLKISSDTDAVITGSFRQVATNTGILVNPVGFSSE